MKHFPEVPSCSEIFLPDARENRSDLVSRETFSAAGLGGMGVLYADS